MTSVVPITIHELRDGNTDAILREILTLRVGVGDAGSVQSNSIKIRLAVTPRLLLNSTVFTTAPISSNCTMENHWPSISRLHANS